MRGIDEESLEQLYKSANSEEIARLIKYLIRVECKELNPWLPIDGDTPKDKDILLWCEFGQRIGYIDAHDGLIRAYGLGIVAPTHYQELPDDPEPGDKNG